MAKKPPPRPPSPIPVPVEQERRIEAAARTRGRAFRVTSVRTRREDRFLHRRLILSQDSAGKGINHVIDSLLALRCSFVRAWRPFLRPGLRVQRSLALPLAPVLPGHTLTVPSTARGLSGSVRGFIGLDALEGAPLVKNRPGDASELVGERNRQHVVV